MCTFNNICFNNGLGGNESWIEKKNTTLESHNGK